MENTKLCTQVSPLLANVYLHELDKFMSKHIEQPRATPIAKIYKKPNKQQETGRTRLDSKTVQKGKV